MFHKYAQVEFGVIHLPRWWPFRRSFALWWIFLTPAKLGDAFPNIMLTVIHEAQHVRDQRRRWLLGFLVPWLLHKPSRLNLEARGFAASVRYARDTLRYDDYRLELYLQRKARSLQTRYWFGGKYSLADCLRAIKRYL